MTHPYKKGLFIGRFQPFHLGHLNAVRLALENCEELVIGIGSSDISGTGENPFDAETRRSIIIAALSDSAIDTKRIEFMMVPDSGNDDEWYNRIMSMHRFDVVFSGNDWVSGIFSERKVDIFNTLPSNYNNELSGTKIRERIRNGEAWEHLLTENSAAIVASQKMKIAATASKTKT